MRESQKCSSLNLYAYSFLVHVVQSVLRWGKDPIVVVKEKRVGNTKRREERISSPLRKSGQSAKDDELFHS